MRDKLQWRVLYAERAVHQRDARKMGGGGQKKIETRRIEIEEKQNPNKRRAKRAR